MMNCSKGTEALSRAVEQITKKHILLHMDINRTIIQVDAAGGKSLEDVLNSNICQRVFGRKREDSSFEIVQSLLDDADELLAGLMSYDEYADTLYAAPPEMATASPADQRAIWKNVTAKRRALLHAFTAEGSPGHSYAPFVDLQRERLAYSVTTEWQIIPSFFHFVNHLSRLDWPFTVVFRTFGNDLHKILWEWNAFVLGNHVVKPEGSVLQRMVDEKRHPTCGALFRNKLGMAVMWDRSHAIPAPHEHRFDEEPPAMYLQSIGGANSEKAHPVSYHELYHEILRKSEEGGGVLGLVDYYYYWSQHAEHRSAGKVFPVLSPQGEENPDVSLIPFQLFFDDNIYVGDAKSIVDMRCAESGEPIALNDEDKYCVGVVPYLAITDNDYFWKEACRRILAQSQIPSSSR